MPIQYRLSFGGKFSSFSGHLAGAQEADYVVRPRVDGLLLAIEDVPRL